MTNTNKLPEALRIAVIVPGIFLVVLSFMFGAVSLSEGYNVFDPYADTEFAKDYTPEKFKLVKEGMTMRDVITVSGEPMNISYDTIRGLIVHTYTRDGYLRRIADKNFSLCGDLAWYGSSVEYNKDSIAVHVYARWYYD